MAVDRVNMPTGSPPNSEPSHQKREIVKARIVIIKQVVIMMKSEVVRECVETVEGVKAAVKVQIKTLVTSGGRI